MIAFLVWLVGLICCIWCVKDVWNKQSIDTVIKIVLTIALLLCSWVGLAVYFFIVKDRIK